MKSNGQACGKLILAGEYSVLFGGCGVAAPVDFHCRVSIDTDKPPAVRWQQPNTVHQLWDEYINEILKAYNCSAGEVLIDCDIPLGKGLGSSTALTAAVGRALHKTPAEIMAAEDIVNPGHSGIDIACILSDSPVRFQAGLSAPEDLNVSLSNTVLIDSGAPNETTKELVAWVRSTIDEKKPAIDAIAAATNSLLQGDDIADCVREHHRGQLALGVVPPLAADIINTIEQLGGSAKIVGAGGRTGGGGMIWCLHLSAQQLQDLNVSFLSLS